MRIQRTWVPFLNERKEETHISIGENGKNILFFAKLKNYLIYSWAEEEEGVLK